MVHPLLHGYLFGSLVLIFGVQCSEDQPSNQVTTRPPLEFCAWFWFEKCVIMAVHHGAPELDRESMHYGKRFF